MYLLFVNQKGANVARLMKKLALMVCCCFWVGAVVAQPTIQWQKTYGGSSYDDASCISLTADGGYILGGTTSSNNGDVFGHHGGLDFWMLKLDIDGTVQWKKVLGGTENEVAQVVHQTVDGGYFIAGYSASNNYDILGNHGGDFDGWIVKLNSNGLILWQKALGGSGWDDIWSAQQTSDNGYILAGRSSSTDGDVTENRGQFDFWIIKLNEAGQIQWQKSLGGSKSDMAKSIKQTSDGGYIVAGETASNDGDVSGLQGNVDFWVVKLSSLGEMEWQKTLGGAGAGQTHQISRGCEYVGYLSCKNNLPWKADTTHLTV